MCTYAHAYVLVVSVCTYCGGLILIIECDSTLYVGMTHKQNGGPIPPIHYNFAKNRIYEMCSFQRSPNTDDPHQWAMGKWDKWFDEVYAEYRASKWDVRVHLCYLPRHNRRTFHSLGGAQKRGLYDIYRTNLSNGISKVRTYISTHLVSSFSIPQVLYMHLHT